MLAKLSADLTEINIVLEYMRDTTQHQFLFCAFLLSNECGNYETRSSESIYISLQLKDSRKLSCHAAFKLVKDLSLQNTRLDYTGKSLEVAIAGRSEGSIREGDDGVAKMTCGRQ